MAREAPVGNVAIIPVGLEPCLGQRTLLIRPNPQKVEPSYLNYLLNGPEVQNLIRSKTSGATVAHLNMKDVRTMKLPVLPALPTQRRIASILSAYDDLIENNNKRIKILDEMARMLYREWFVHFRFPDHEKVKMVDSPLGKIPEGWEVGRFDDALVLQRGFDLPKKKRVDGSFPIYASTGVTGTHNEPKVKGPGVLTGRSGSLGTVIYVEEDFWPLNTTLWVKEFKKASAYWGFYLLSHQDLKGLDGGAAVPTLNRNYVHALQIVIPPRILMDVFDQNVGPIFALKRKLSQKIEILRQTRDLLLPKLISGEIDMDGMDVT